MIDYSKYPYGQMLSYVERRCKELNEDKNYVEYITCRIYRETNQAVW